MRLTDEQVAKYHADGFLVIGRLVDDGTLDKLRAAYEDLLDGRVTSPEDRLLGGATRQILNPSNVHPVFDSNPAVDAATEIMDQLWGPSIRTYDTLIYKPPGHPHAMPWHQDEAYSATPVAEAGRPIGLGEAIQFWVALDDADVENGCMHFVPGYHRGILLEHRVNSGAPDDPTRELAMVDPERDLDLSKVVAAPIPAGWATMHSAGTPHFTPPNRSADRRRRAYIFNLAPLTMVERILEIVAAQSLTKD